MYPCYKLHVSSTECKLIPVHRIRVSIFVFPKLVPPAPSPKKQQLIYLYERVLCGFVFFLKHQKCMERGLSPEKERFLREGTR